MPRSVRDGFPGLLETFSIAQMTSSSAAEPRRIDMHVHMVCNGGGGSGGWLRLRSRWHRWLAGFMLHQLGLPADALEADLDTLYADFLLRKIRDAPSIDAVVLLAHEQVYDERGELQHDRGTMYVPNDLVLTLAKQHPEFLAAVSINPARRDAVAELERCAAEGAVLMKCLPNCQNINPSNTRYRRFWETMAELRLPLLAHTGGEHTVEVVEFRYGDPKLLRLPLECGVTVIAAHCATRSGVFERDYFSDWRQMTAEFPNLYGDISALVSLNRCGHLRDCLDPEILPRILHGSDFPVPVLGHRLWLQRWIDTPTFRRCQAIENPLERDWQYKRALGFGDETLTRLGALLRSSTRMGPVGFEPTTKGL
jgi:predicted TIM-barrel fold metal-dependent hydrolase